MNQRINYEKVAQVALDYALTKSAVGNFSWQNALLGAGLGAGGGALTGLLAPSKDDEDEDDTTGSMLRRGLLGGGLGGLLGGFGGNYLGSLFQGSPTTPTLPTLGPAQSLAPHIMKDIVRTGAGAGGISMPGSAAKSPRQDAKPLQRVPDSGPPKPTRQDSASQLSPRLQQIGAGYQPGVNYEGLANALAGSGRPGAPPSYQESRQLGGPTRPTRAQALEARGLVE